MSLVNWQSFLLHPLQYNWSWADLLPNRWFLMISAIPWMSTKDDFGSKSMVFWYLAISLGIMEMVSNEGTMLVIGTTAMRASFKCRICLSMLSGRGRSHCCQELKKASLAGSTSRDSHMIRSQLAQTERRYSEEEGPRVAGATKRIPSIFPRRIASSAHQCCNNRNVEKSNWKILQRYLFTNKRNPFPAGSWLLYSPHLLHSI